MERKSITWNIKQVTTMITKKNILFDLPGQRPEGQWTTYKSSMLIVSIFDMFIPDIYMIKIVLEKGNVYTVVDGKQRLTILNGFINNEWAIDDLGDRGTIKLESSGETYNISNKTFSELPEEIQEEIKGFSLSFKIVEVEDDEDIEEVANGIIERLNSGVAMSKEHLVLLATPKNIQEFTYNTIKENPLFTTVAKYSSKALLKSEKEMTICQSVALVAGLDYKSFSCDDIKEVLSNSEIDQTVLEKLSNVFVSIAETFSHEKSKFATRVNIPAMVALLWDLEGEELDKAQDFLICYSATQKPGDNYRRFCGAGSTKKENVLGRIEALKTMFAEYKSKNQNN